MDYSTIAAWQELGFYYDFDSRIEVNQWRFYGSRQGLSKLADLWWRYSQNPANDFLSADAHYGPYSYLKLITLAEPVITGGYLGGRLLDFEGLSNWFIAQLAQAEPGQVLSLDSVYGLANTATAKCFVMATNFDPASLDELVISDRQAIVNNHWQSQQKKSA